MTATGSRRVASMGTRVGRGSPRCGSPRRGLEAKGVGLHEPYPMVTDPTALSERLDLDGGRSGVGGVQEQCADGQRVAVSQGCRDGLSQQVAAVGLAADGPLLVQGDLHRRNLWTSASGRVRG